MSLIPGILGGESPPIVQPLRVYRFWPASQAGLPGSACKPPWRLLTNGRADPPRSAVLVVCGLIPIRLALETLAQLRITTVLPIATARALH